MLRTGLGQALLKAFLAAEKDIPRAAHSCSAQRSRDKYFRVAHISRICLCLSRLPPGRSCLAFAAVLAVCLRHAGDPTPDTGCSVGAPSNLSTASLFAFSWH